MNKPAAKRKGSPIIFVQIGVVLLVAAAIAAGLYVQSQGTGDATPLLATPLTPARPQDGGGSLASASKARLVYNLNNNSFSGAVELGGAVHLGLLDANGMTSTLTLSVPSGAPYEMQGHYLTSFNSSPPGTIRVFTATYTVQDIVAPLIRQFSPAITATTAVGESYSFSPALVAPDGNSIAYVLGHQQFISNGLQVQLTWSLLRANLITQTQTTIASGKLAGSNIPAVLPIAWSSRTNQIYLNLQQDPSLNSAATLNAYNADGSGAGKQVDVPSPFIQPSPDGSKLVYLDNDAATFVPQQPNNTNRITILDLQDGSSRHISVAGNSIEPNFAWSPDSQSLAYVERLGPPPPAVGGTPAANLFYHILLRRLDAGTTQPTTISEYLAGASINPGATNSNLAWCGDHLYIQIISFIGQGQTRTALYEVPADAQSGFQPAVAGDWPYQILGCVP